MDFSPFSLLVVKVFSLITGGLGAEACAQILKVPLEELEPIIADLKEGGLLQSDPDRPARIMITSRGVAELQMRNAWREVCAEIADVASALDEGQNLEACTLLLGFINTLLNSSQSSGAVACYGLVLRLLGRWSPAGAASGQKQAFMKLALAACDISMYLSKSHRQAREIAARALETAKEQGDARMTALLHLVESSLENMAAECSAQRMHELHAQCETSLLELDKAGARGRRSILWACSTSGTAISGKPSPRLRWPCSTRSCGNAGSRRKCSRCIRVRPPCIWGVSIRR